MPSFGGSSLPPKSKHYQACRPLCSVKTTPCYSYEGKTGEGRNLVIFIEWWTTGRGKLNL